MVKCACSYCCDRDFYIQGNRIFQEINTNLNFNEITNPEERAVFENCKELLEASEKERKEIADKFEAFLHDTGACVLKQPTIERGLITYVIFLLSQIIICINQKVENFDINELASSFSLSNFIVFSKEAPFISLKSSILDDFKAKYNFDFNVNENLIKGRDSIKKLFSTLENAKKIFENQYNNIKKLSSKNLNIYYTLKTLYNSTDGIRFLISYLSEIANGIIDTQSGLTNQNKIQLYFEIALKAARRMISDPKEIALYYAIGDNCGKIENWKENITYKEIKLDKY